jgi:DUF1365 family protein
MIRSRLYPGVVRHVRVRPRRHELSYRIVQVLLDLDEIEDLDGRLRLFSTRGFNLTGFQSRDHLAGTDQPLKAQVQAHLAAAGIDTRGGAIRLLCMPRILGHAFNPISLYFCHTPDGGLAAILYEVNNTFGQRHSYLIPTRPEDVPGDRIVQTCDKAFYVSPFMPMDLTYRFKVREPGARVSVNIAAADPAGPMLFASFSGEARPLTDANLARAAAGALLLGLKVLAAIHWEALRIWLKGLRLQPRPAPPSRPVTLASAGPTDAPSPALTPGGIP